ncbi:MAG: amidohydrolase family protein, partial [Bacteroidota bacterium]
KKQYAERKKQQTDKNKEWFLENFVHPRAWRKVLDKFPELHLCLAHFGGDEWEAGPSESDWIQELIDMLKEKDCAGNPKYPNLYTDISCFSIDKNMPQFRSVMRMMENKELWDRVLFGTDWYMTHLACSRGQQEYKDFCLKIKKELDEIGDSFWIKATLLNPVRFYGFDNKMKMNNLYDKLADKLRDSSTNTTTLEINYRKLTKAMDKIETIKSSLQNSDCLYRTDDNLYQWLCRK